MMAPCSPLHIIARLENTSQGGGLGTWANDSSLLPLVCNSKVGEHLTRWGSAVNDSSMLPLVYNSKVGEQLTGWWFGVWDE